MSKREFNNTTLGNTRIRKGGGQWCEQRQDQKQSKDHGHDQEQEHEHKEDQQQEQGQQQEQAQKRAEEQMPNMSTDGHHEFASNNTNMSMYMGNEQKSGQEHDGG